MNSTKPSLGYFKGLDVLRFIAASCVLFHHISLFLPTKGVPLHSARYHIYSGSFFLDLFFVISGFLIAIILFSELQARVFSLKKFFTRRILRIWPLYFFIVIMKVMLIPLYGKDADPDEVLANLKYAMTFTVNFQLLFEEYKSTYKILWSVCVEEQLYLVFPFLVLLFKKALPYLALLLVVIGILSWFFIADLLAGWNTHYSIAYFFPTSYLYYFGLGVLLAWLYHRYQQGLFAGTVAKILGAKPVQGLIILVGLAFVFNTITDTAYTTGVLLLLNGALAFYLVYLGISNKFLLDFIGPKTSRLMGNLSYAMYLVHPMMMGPAFRLTKKMAPAGGDAAYNILMPLIALLYTVISALVLHYLVERPFLKLKKRFVQVENR